MAEAQAKNRDKRTKPRIKVQIHAKIKAQLIGSANKYPFITENISESGLLVTHVSHFRHSFNSHSILEVWVQNDREEEIFFFAKYVRKASETSFAIRIIDIDPTNVKKYQEFIDSHRDETIVEDKEEDEE